MTQRTPQHQPEGAAMRLAAKLTALQAGSPLDEQRASDAGLHRAGVEAEDVTEDAAGYIIPVSVLPQIVVKVREQAAQPSGSNPPSQSAPVR